MSKLIISVSGIRGIVGETLTPDVAQRFALAFASSLKGRKKVIIGSDTRITRDMMLQAVNSGLLACGCEVIDVGIAPTPTIQYLVKDLHADGGIVISASHNPIEWNALKLYKKGGILLNKKEGDRIKKLFNEQKYNYVKWNKYQKYIHDPGLIERHLDQTIKSMHYLNKIRQKKFKVALDSCNASGSFITQDLLKRLSCSVKGLYVTPDGYFPHDPEPNTRNLQKMIRFMKKSSYDIGFAQDSDADRLAVLDEKGNFLSEECTVALVCYYILSIYNQSKKLQKYNRSVVVNLSTSRMVDDVARMFGARVYRTAVGEINVVEKLMSTRSVIAGEGNGGVIFPEINYGRDSLAGIGLILDCLAYYNEKLSVLLSRIPVYVMLKTKFNIEKINIKKLIKDIKSGFRKGMINETDGLKMDFPDYWFHIRTSNTEPIVRLIIEARNQKLLNEVLKQIQAFFK